MVVPGRVKRCRMTEIVFNVKENSIARSSLVDALKVIKGIAKVVHGITPVTNWSVIVCHNSTNAVLNATDVALLWCMNIVCNGQSNPSFITASKTLGVKFKIFIDIQYSNNRYFY
jgi:hypothetical protein